MTPPFGGNWREARCQAAGETLVRIFAACGYQAVGRPSAHGAGLAITVDGCTTPLETGSVGLLWRGEPLAGEAPDWPGGISSPAARFFLTARPLDAPVALDLDLAARRDFGNPFYMTSYVRERVKVLLGRGEDLTPSAPEIIPEEGRALVLLTLGFPGAVRRAAERFDPYPVNRYAAALAGELWWFARTVPMTGENRRLGRGAEIVLQNALGLLGSGCCGAERRPL